MSEKKNKKPKAKVHGITDEANVIRLIDEPDREPEEAHENDHVNVQPTKRGVRLIEDSPH